MMLIWKSNRTLSVFCRELREHGLSVTPAEVVTAATALQVIDTSDRDEVFLSLRSVLTTSVDDFPIFEELFEDVLEQVAAAQRQRPCASKLRRHVNRPRDSHSSSNTGPVRLARGAQPVKVPGASDTESHAEKDFSEFSNEELEEISRLARRIVKTTGAKTESSLATRRTRSRVNLRRSLRLSLKTGGELIDLAYKERRPKRTKLVRDLRRVRIDGHLQPAAAAICLRTSKQFCESRIVCFRYLAVADNGRLKNKTYQRALDRLSANVQGWSGGTRIGASLAMFNAQWLRRIDKRTIVIILSDGWDTGEPEQLAAALSQLKRACRPVDLVESAAG